MMQRELSLARLYETPEEYRLGWVRGFYEGRQSSEDARLGRILRHGVQDEADRYFLAGYRHGLAAHNRGQS